MSQSPSAGSASMASVTGTKSSPVWAAGCDVEAAPTMAAADSQRAAVCIAFMVLTPVRDAGRFALMAPILPA